MSVIFLDAFLFSFVGFSNLKYFMTLKLEHSIIFLVVMINNYFCNIETLILLFMKPVF